MRREPGCGSRPVPEHGGLAMWLHALGRGRAQLWNAVRVHRLIRPHDCSRRIQTALGVCIGSVLYNALGGQV